MPDAGNSVMRNALTTLITLLVLGAVGLASVGLLGLTQATEGVGFVALGCFVLILARILQAAM